MTEPSEPRLQGEPDPHALAVACRLLDAGYRAYLAGGCVRDLLLGAPPKDYDIATDAHPEAVMEVFARTVAVGAQFGVVKVIEGGTEYDVATFRADGDYPDGRHPSRVTFCGPEEDVQRRDFTINGLLLDPRSLAVVDYVGGTADLAAGVVRAIGDPAKRFAEDALRLMRAVRFAARLGYAIEPKTLAALRAAVDGIARVSKERIRDELLAILTGAHAGEGLRLLEESGLLSRILPDVAALRGVEQPPQFHPEGDCFVHTCMMLDMLDHPGPELAMGVLLHDVGKPPTYEESDRIRFPRHEKEGATLAARICRDLRFSAAQAETITALVGEHMRFMNVDRMRESKLKRFLGQPHFDEHLELHRVDCLASHGKLGNHEFCRQKRVEFADTVVPPRLLTGHDLIAMGYAPGPHFKEILTAVEDAALENRIATKEEAEQLVRDTFPA
jgi:poly(A) polymerase